MKKLMTMIGVAAMAFGLYADFKYNQTDFSATPVGPLDISKNDAGGDTTPFYWAGEAGDSEVKAVSADEGAARFLAIDNSAPLYRTVNSGPNAAAQEIGTGVFADMTVKFTASDSTEPIVLADGAKLGIWVAADEESETPSTNLMVCAASLVKGATVPVATNFTIDVGANFDFTAEHRVTIRAIDEISSGTLGMAGFVIYVDGALVAAADADYADKIGFTAFNTVAAPFYAQKQLFVSLVEAGTLGAQKITGVGFKGSGELAKVALTDADNAPEFAKPAVNVTIAWDNGVTGFTYQGIVTNVNAAGSVVVTLASPSVPVTLSNVTIDTANYVDGGIDAVNLSSSEAGVWTFTAAPASLTMKAAPVAFTIGDEKFATFEGALKAAGGKTIKLAKDFAIGGTAYINIGDEAGEAPISTTIDLAGKNIDVANGQPCGFYVGLNSTLAVIDTVGGGTLTASKVADDFSGVFYADGNCMIGNEDDDQGIKSDALIGSGSSLTIVKGKFLDISGVQGQEDIGNYVNKDKYEVVADGAYWKVQKKQAKNFVIEIVDGKQYETIDEALAAAQDGDELKLLDNVALGAYIEIRKTITFDLGGKTLSSATGVFDVYAMDVVIKNGSITAANGCGVWVDPNGSATIASDVTITVADTAKASSAGVVVQGAASATVNGTIVQNSKGSAIAGLGNAGDAGSTIAVGATASLTSAGPGIYFPVTGGTLTIADGAAISAVETAVEIKAGKVNIGAATIATTADSATEAKNDNGNSTTGYALAIVGNKAYGDNIELTVAAGAKFTGKVGIVKDDEDAPAPKSIAIANGALFTDKVGAATLIDAQTQQMAKVADEAGFYAVEAKKGGDIPADPAKDITDNTKPADIGLDPAGPFKDAEKAELIKLSTWANKAGVKAAAINAGMTFGVGGAPLTEMAEAYLLDCTPAQLTEAKAAFKFNAADLAAAMAGTVNPKTFADKSYNGTIVIKAFSDVACETPAADGAAAKFYKAFLVK